ncbi:MAG: hypothetical protein ACLQUW_15970 [Desulfobaccales bacterium]
MKRIDALFDLHRAKSDLFNRYKAGPVPYVGNGLSDNAVVGLVTPLPTDRVFGFMGIAVSAFCEASVQAPPFVACGRAGNGLVVLEPKHPLRPEQLAYMASYINLAVRWRFSWYWQTTADRIARLMVPAHIPSNVRFPVIEYMPKMNKPKQDNVQFHLQRFALGSLFDLIPGDYHNYSVLPAGNIPIISCGNLDNGVCGYFQVDKGVYENRMTIAFNGSTLSAKYHPYKFAAKDDVAICTPKVPMSPATQSLIIVMLKREQWRFSYYRKCYKAKLERVTVPLPATALGMVDEDAIAAIIETTPYAAFIDGR